jgi:uncharacterized protein (DUF1778 family)
MAVHDSDDASGQAHEPRTSRDGRLNLRTSVRQDRLIRAAASTVHKSVTEFVLESASQAAEQVLADRRAFALDDASWEAFQEALERPVILKPRLSELLRAADPFDD